MPAVPGFALDLLIGEFGEILLASQRAVPKAAQAAGFRFRFEELEPALRAILQ
jgi:NAD dependent epimerase/dehydratase family enzyme